jgi:DNA mismatch repair protein MutS2
MKILRNLCGLIKEVSDALIINQIMFTKLDFMFAKGEYANKTNSKIAKLSDNTLKLIKAKHPLIDRDKVVSNNFCLSNEGKKVLIISGPNTGGKSVALKTVGILSYMNQCGLMIPVVGEAILPVFDNIYVDIGDNQSIISSLSTFSSHISNIAYILNNITNKSAVDKMKNEYDCKDDKLMILSMFLFPYGLYFFYKNRNDEPLRSSSALGGAFLGIIIICIFITFFLVGSLLG